MEVFLPWRDSWHLLAPLPAIGYQQMFLTRITSLSLMGQPRVYLLGGRAMDLVTNSVWMLEWNRTLQSYYWSKASHHAMGEVLPLYSSSLTGMEYEIWSREAAVPDTFLSAFYRP